MATRPAPVGYLFSKGYTHYIFILLWLPYFFDYVDRWMTEDDADTLRSSGRRQVLITAPGS